MSTNMCVFGDILQFPFQKCNFNIGQMFTLQSRQINVDFLTVGTSTATRIEPEVAAILLVTFFLWLQQAPSH